MHYIFYTLYIRHDKVYPPETSKVFHNLHPGQPYSWTLTASTKVGEGPRLVFPFFLKP